MIQIPTLSVVIPSFNIERWLGDCLRSVLGQSFTDLEVVVVDDGSTDRSADIAAFFTTTDPRVRVLRQANAGPGAARNAGLDAARGRYVAFIDGDDLVAPGAFERLVGSLERTGSDFATNPIEEFGGPERRRYWTNRGPEFRTPLAGVNLDTTPGLILDHSPVNKVFRTDFLRAADARWPQNLRHEDVLQAALAYSRAGSIDVLPEVGYFYRRRGGSETSGLARPALLRDWVTVTAAALRVLSDEGRLAARSVFAGKALVDELVSRLPALRAAGSAPDGLAGLVGDLVTFAPPSSLAGTAPELRWQIAALALGRIDLLPVIHDPRLAKQRPAEALTLDGDLPAELRRSLGLGSRRLAEAFRAGPLRNGTVTALPEAGPLVSVIVPTHNVGEYLDETLRSIRASHYRSIEVVVVDDHSTDHTWAILQRHAAEDARLRVYRSTGRGGAQARNLALSLARGAYFAFADADDLVPPRAYAAMVSAAERTDADVVIGKYLHSRPNQTWDPSERYGYTMPLEEIRVEDHTLPIGDRSSWNKLFRAEFWRAESIAFASVPRGNDIVPLGVAMTAGPRLTVIPDAVYVYRTRPGAGSMTAGMQSGRPESIASWAAQEAIYAHLVRQADLPAVSREYWNRALPAHLSYNLRPYLAARAVGSNVADAVPDHLNHLLTAAPEHWLAGQEARFQALLALLCAGRTATAAELAGEVWGTTRLSLSASITTLVEVADTGRLGADALARLAWRWVVRRLALDGATASDSELERAAAVLRTLEREHHAVPATVPGGHGDRILRALREGGIAEIRAAIARPTRIRRTRLAIRPTMAVLSSTQPLATTGRAHVVAVSGSGTQARRLPLGHVVASPDGSGWSAVLRADAVPAGVWKLAVEYEDRWGLVRRPLTFKAGRREVLTGRFARLAPTRAGSCGDLVVHRPLGARLRSALSARRG